jgi:hypothetical protein
MILALPCAIFQETGIVDRRPCSWWGVAVVESRALGWSTGCGSNIAWRRSTSRKFTRAPVLAHQTHLTSTRSLRTNTLSPIVIAETAPIMSAGKRPAHDAFGSSQLVKRPKADANLGASSAVAVVNGAGQNGALVQAVCHILAPLQYAIAEAAMC